jgi:OOP family OmpA-OmpF porin
MQREKREADTSPLGTPVAIQVVFETNSATVKPEYYADLDKLGRGLTAQQFANGCILIAGHTDSVGSAPYNKRLSEKRVESVKQYLMKSFRIDSNRLQTVGYGEEKRLIEIDDTPAAQAKNRRVEVMSLRQ